ncbi:uncharacterized protein F5147DRAFT_658493 [Suillus discolor]|uniref:Uncharacterized protein n=1 Tax=Suillus discolor TaxID=1912936 RepID=A0A9P7EU14_9AGAM|nr:uncharacterized protein F5147DRAFT_658493 [Suillus discolor]KAG2089137.1 hypothetical protein F5147DRAFT_658493 [Suillus discolor]
MSAVADMCWAFVYGVCGVAHGSGFKSGKPKPPQAEPKPGQNITNWIKWLKATGIPLSKCTIAPKVESLCGRIQLGGGRKTNGELFFFAQGDKSKYKHKSDDLELVTILETVCTNGTATVKPCFIFSGTYHSSEWYDAPDGVL